MTRGYWEGSHRLRLCIVSFIVVSESCRWGGTVARSIRDLKELLVYLFEGIDALLKLDVIRWELGLDTMFQLRGHGTHDSRGV